MRISDWSSDVCSSDLYTRTVFGGSNNALLVTKGDELPGAPWQVRLSGTYDFDTGDDKAFVQLNYDYSSSYQRLPTAFNTDTTIMDAGATHFVSGRTGITIGNVQAALFVDNMLNSRESLYRTRESRSEERRCGKRGVRPGKSR